MRYQNLNDYSTDELKDLYDTLFMSRCRCMFPSETHAQYYEDIDLTLNDISETLKKRSLKEKKET